VLGDFDKSKVEKNFPTIIERHESLRTSLIIVDDELKQIVLPFHLNWFNIQENRYEETIQSFVRPFDLTAAPLLALGFMEKSPKEHLMDSHHIVMDGMSRFVLREEFNTLPTVRNYRN
jgi:hypothetical protein